MGQITGKYDFLSRVNFRDLATLPTPAAGEYILVSSDNSMNAVGQGNFDCYIEGDGTKAATALPLKSIMPLDVFDLSAYTGSTYVDFAAALNAMNVLPTAFKIGGMSIKFVQSSDSKYVQYRLMHPLDNSSTAATDFANTANWQGVDNEPTVGSKNLVESEGVKKAVLSVIGEMANKDVTVSGTTTTSTAIYLKNGVKYVIYVQCSTATTNANAGVYVYDGSSFTQIKQLTAAEYAAGAYIEYIAGSDVRLYVRPYSSGTVKVTVWQVSDYPALADVARKEYELAEKTDSMLNSNSIGSNIGYIQTNGVLNNQSGWTYFQTNISVGDKIVLTASNGGSSACYTCALIPYDGTETIVVATGSKANLEYTATKGGLLYVNNLTSQQAAPYLKFVSGLEGKFTANDIKNAIASEAFTYSNIVKTDGNLTSANVTWPDGATGAMSITYTSGNPSQIDYTHVANGNSRSFRQTITYSNGEVVSNTIIEL